jgi:pimeloyl-ACP methyl ester carboxylesterase
MKVLISLCFLIAAGLSSTVLASDLAKEKRWADQIVEFLIDGEAEWLEADGQRFLAIYTEAATDTPRGGVIVVHGSGVHPNWQDVVHPLRTGLTEKGWTTLSIQMPVLHNEAEYHEYAPLFDEVAPRLRAAVQNLRDKGIDHIVIVAHSLGTAMTAYYLSSNPDHGVKAFVAVGMPQPREDQRMNTVAALKKISIPVLDIYGSRDLEGILKSAPQRKAAGSGNKQYTQQVVDGADHFFVNKNKELIGEVDGWIRRF